MKKLLALILSILYLTTSVGATIHFHYCMDKLVSWGFQSDEDEACGNCGMNKEESKGCCKDEHKQIKIQCEQKAVNSNLSLFNFPIELSEPVADQSRLLPDLSFIITYPVSHAPPQRANIPLYLSNSVFRI